MSIERDLRHVGDLMAIRMLLAECFAELARSQESPSTFIATTKARLLRRMGDLDPVSADDNNVLQASCASCISSVLSQAQDLAAAQLPTKPPVRRGGRARAAPTKNLR
jgi:hypothetical protein